MSIEWRDVVSLSGKYIGRYQVSNLGDVRAHPESSVRGMKPGRALSQGSCERGYPQVSLWLNGRTTIKVHRLVAEAFIAKRPVDTTINHIDGDKKNNAVSNLEYVTNLENKWHAYRVVDKMPAVVVAGERMSVAEATHRFGASGLTSKSVRRRIDRLGWSLEKALSVPIQPTGRPRNGQVRA